MLVLNEWLSCGVILQECGKLILVLPTVVLSLYFHSYRLLHMSLDLIFDILIGEKV